LRVRPSFLDASRVSCGIATAAADIILNVVQYNVGKILMLTWKQPE